jgi:hypothetical protein
MPIVLSVEDLILPAKFIDGQIIEKYISIYKHFLSTKITSLNYLSSFNGLSGYQNTCLTNAYIASYQGFNLPDEFIDKE